MDSRQTTCLQHIIQCCDAKLYASAGGLVWAVLRCNSCSVYNIHAAPGCQGLRGAVPFLVTSSCKTLCVSASVMYMTASSSCRLPVQLPMPLFWLCPYFPVCACCQKQTMCEDEICALQSWCCHSQAFVHVVHAGMHVTARSAAGH